MTRKVAPCSSSTNDCEELLDNSEVIKAAPRACGIVPYLTNMFGRERKEPERETSLISPSKRSLFMSDASAFNLLQRKRSKSSPNSLSSARDSRSNSHGSVWSPVPDSLHKMSSQVSMCSAATLSTGESSILESLTASQAEEEEEEEEMEVLMLTDQQPEQAERSPSRDTARDTAVSGPVDRFQSLTMNDSASTSEVIPFNSDEILPGRDMVAVAPRKEKRNVDFRFLAAPTPSTLLSELSLSELA